MKNVNTLKMFKIIKIVIGIIKNIFYIFGNKPGWFYYVNKNSGHSLRLSSTCEEEFQ